MNSESLGDRYQLVRMIGSGGMGSVYEGVDLATGSRVAIKLLRDNAAAYETNAPLRLSRLKREGRVMRAIDAPHVVSVLDAGMHPKTGAPFLVLELLEGEDLQRTIDRLGPLPPPLALKVVAQACLGLQAAHAAGVVHRDIKPANLFLERRGGEIIVKLLDFGIAKLQRVLSVEQASTLTDSGTLLGSMYYMSPDQLRSAKRSDHRADIWSLGAVLYCALTGCAPHAEIKVFVSLIAALCTQPPLPVRQIAPWVPAEAARIVEVAMAIDPTQRFQSAIEVLDALRPLLPDGFALREEMLTPQCFSCSICDSVYSPTQPMS
jgi:eukaryotic-like serine/threonine-protein kinase